MNVVAQYVKSYLSILIIASLTAPVHALVKRMTQRVGSSSQSAVIPRLNYDSHRTFWGPSVGRVMEWPATQKGQLDKYAVTLQYEQGLTGDAEQLYPYSKPYSEHGLADIRFELSSADFDDVDKSKFGAIKNKEDFANTVKLYDQATRAESQARENFQELELKMRKRLAYTAEELETLKRIWEEAGYKQQELYNQLIDYRAAIVSTDEVQATETPSAVKAALPALKMQKELQKKRALRQRLTELAKAGNFEAVRTLIPQFYKQGRTLDQLVKQYRFSPDMSERERQAIRALVDSSSMQQKGRAMVDIVKSTGESKAMKMAPDIAKSLEILRSCSATLLGKAAAYFRWNK